MSSSRPQYKGVFANMPTALTAGGKEFDSGRMRDHVQWVLDEGVHGMSCLLGSGGFTYLRPEERREVVACVVKAVDGRASVLAGVTGESTSETIRLAQDAADAGADVVMVQPRSFLPLTPSEILRHFETVAGSANAPIGIYNHPPTTGVSISPALYAEIVDATGAVVTKDGALELFNVPEILNACGDRLDYLSGNESLMLAAFALGAPGCCIAMASVLPRELAELYEAMVVSQDLEAGRDVYERLLPVLREFRRIGTPRAVKAAADIRGRALGPQRPPVLDVPADDVARLRTAMAEAGIPGV